MRRLLLMIVFAAAASAANSQYSKTIETDRLGEGKSAYVQSLKSFQAEFGFQKSKESSGEYVYLHPEFTFRYGITNWLEGRAQSDFRTEKFNDGKQSGLKPVRLGFKALLTEGSKIIPHASVLFQVGLPFLASKDFQPPHAAPEFRFLFENEISEKLNITYNAGANWDGEATNPQYMYSLSPEYTISEKLQLFAEMFGFIQEHQEAETNVDAGIGYLLSDDLKLDVNAGWGLSAHATDHFYALGISMRFR